MRLFALLALLCMSMEVRAQDNPAVAQLRALLGDGNSLSFARATPLPGPAEGVMLHEVVISNGSERNTIASLSLSGLRSNGVDSLVARDVVTTTPDGPLRIGRIALGGLVAYQRTDGTAQQADDVKLRELLVENVTIPGRPVITIGRLALNAYGSGQLSRGEVSDITMTDIPEDPIDGASIGRFSFSGINLAGLASDAVAQRVPGRQARGRPSLSLDNLVLRGRGEVLASLANFSIEGEVNDQGSGEGSVTLRGLTAEPSEVAAPFLAMVGLERLNAGLTLRGRYDAASGRLVMPAFSLELRDVAAVTLGLSMDGLTADAARAQDFSRMRLADARLRLADHSLYQRALQALASEQGGDTQAVRELHAQIIAGLLTSTRPEPAMEALREVLLRFIRGEINVVELQAKPAAPLSLELLGLGLVAAVVQGPAGVIRQLGLSARGERQR